MYVNLLLLVQLPQTTYILKSDSHQIQYTV